MTETGDHVATEPAHGEGETIVFLGDSLTQDGDWAAWFPEYNVVNQGVGGDTTDDVLARLDRVVAARPDSVLLLVGTNDLATRRSVEHLVRNIQSILVQLRRDLPGSRMLLQSILPRGREFAEQIRDANIHLRQFAATVRAQYLDLWPVFAQARRRARADIYRGSPASERRRIRCLVVRASTGAGAPARPAADEPADPDHPHRIGRAPASASLRAI